MAVLFELCAFGVLLRSLDFAALDFSLRYIPEVTCSAFADTCVVLVSTQSSVILLMIAWTDPPSEGDFDSSSSSSTGSK